MKLPTIYQGALGAPHSRFTASSVLRSLLGNPFSRASRLRLSASLLTAALLAVGNVSAGTTSQATTAPTANVLVGSNPVPAATGSTQFKKTANTDQFGGVAFNLSSAASVDAVSFYVHGAGTGAANAMASISIVSFSSLTSEAITAPYTKVFSETFTMPANVAANNYLTFSFTAPPSLQAGTYGIVFQWLQAATDESINFRAAGSASSALQFRTSVDKDGNVTAQENGTASQREMLFLVQGTSQIPEPATYAGLAGLVTLAGVVGLRRRPRQSCNPSVRE